MLCILSVFIPAFIMAEPVRSLFVPLSLAVGFAMISSYLLSSTLVPVLSVWLLKHHDEHKQHDEDKQNNKKAQSMESRGWFSRIGAALLFPFQWVGQRLFGAKDNTNEKAGEHKGGFERFQEIFGWVVGGSVRWRWVVVPVYLGVCTLILLLLGTRLGKELFPKVDSGEFVLRFRLPPGTNFELTRQAWVHSLQTVEKEVGPENVKISMGFAGQQAPDYGMNNMLLFMRGPDDAQMRVQLREGSDQNIFALQERLRKSLPDDLKSWFAQQLQEEGLSPKDAEEEASKIQIAFEPGDIVSEVMSFGAPAPIEIVLAGPDIAVSRQHANRVLAELKQISTLRDVQIQESLDYPTVPIVIDREQAGLSGLTAKQVGQSVLVSTYSSRMVARNYWQDKKSGVSYQVQVQVPQQQMDSPDQVKTMPLQPGGAGTNLMVRDIAKVGQGVEYGEYDRLSMQRYLSITANVEGTDLGRASSEVEEALKRAGTPPHGVTVSTRGQVKPMNEMFTSLWIGLGVAVGVILVLLTGYFQSPRLAIASVGAVPGVLSGVVLILLLTGTTLNIESFMGAIMSIGVSVSNSVMLITFTAKDWREGKHAREAAESGARERLRPILMTACAMIVGMVPMALALERGSQMQAPLGRAVIGGLFVSTFATLLILPSLFALIMGDLKHKSPSLSPNDEESKHHHPEEESGKNKASEGNQSEAQDNRIKPDVGMQSKHDHHEERTRRAGHENTPRGSDGSNGEDNRLNTDDRQPDDARDSTHDQGDQP
jgi:multidrug efflux pump subunit AcrB